ncbi:uncharacterized protein LOC113146549 [Cyclospora cayetanensis]|uniref:Uncharacterized protein LOC113146549 n=1 Tax=Cyclospora cayetanensis TaxID=88456 RepID=A0A6P6RQH5_9EIME|nr:uncharacterized protein LOC113146549 [Cyclospora cayetanensis]
MVGFAHDLLHGTASLQGYEQNSLETSQLTSPVVLSLSSAGMRLLSIPAAPPVTATPPPGPSMGPPGSPARLQAALATATATSYGAATAAFFQLYTMQGSTTVPSFSIHTLARERGPALRGSPQAASAEDSDALRVLLYNGTAYTNIPVRRCQLLSALPESNYAAIRTVRRGTRLIGANTNIDRLLLSAAVQGEHSGLSAGGSTAEESVLKAASPTSAIEEGRRGPSAEECQKFRIRVWQDLRKLLRLCYWSAAAAPTKELSTAEAERAIAATAEAEPATAAAAATSALMLPEGIEASITLVLTRLVLPDLLGALGLPPNPVENTSASAATTAVLDPLDVTARSPDYLPQLTSTDMNCSSLNLVLLAEPLIPSPAIFHCLQEQEEEEEELRDSLGALEHGLGRLRRNHQADSSNLRHSNSLRWCNALLLPHRGRENPEVKSTVWALERQELLREAQDIGAALSMPLEEVILERQNSLLEGCSSNFLVFSDSRKCVLTAPESACLPGCVRGLAIKALSARGIKTVYEAPRWEERETSSWKAAWISSSSRLLLPVRSLIKVKHPHLRSQKASEQQQKEKQQALPQQQQQQPPKQPAMWVAVPSLAATNSPAYSQSLVEDCSQGQHILQPLCDEQQLPKLPASEYEEALFDVGPDSLAARVARWTAELAEQEAEAVFP